MWHNGIQISWLRPRQFADYTTMGLTPKELSIWFNQALKFVDG